MPAARERQYQNIPESSDGKRFTFTLVIRKIPKSTAKNILDRYHVFATTVHCHSYRQLFYYVTKEYRNRWGIKTGYRCAKSVRPWTVSENPVMRMLLFYVSPAVCNIWLTMRDSADPKARVMTLLTRVCCDTVFVLPLCARCRQDRGWAAAARSRLDGFAGYIFNYCLDQSSQIEPTTKKIRKDG